MTWDSLPPEADTSAATNDPAGPATSMVAGNRNVHLPPVLRTSWVTDTVAVPPEVNNVPGCCAPSASCAAVHGPAAAAVGAAGVVAGGEVTGGVVAAVLARAAGDAWLGGAVTTAAEAADVLVVTDGWTGPP